MKLIKAEDKIYTISKLSKQFEEHVIFENVCLDINRGDFATLIGKSGSGKTTFLNIIGLLDKKFDGDIFFLGHSIKNEKKIDDLRSKEIGYLFQSFYLLDYLTVRENILLPFKYTFSSPDLDYFDELCNKLNLTNLLDSKSNILSGGEKQRVSLARALIKKPTFLICDEPTGNLDKENRDIVLNLLEKINKEFSTTIIVVTHDEFIASKGNRRFVLNERKIYEAN